MDRQHRFFMNRQIFTVIGMLSLLTLVLAACGTTATRAGDPAPAANASQTTEGGGVTIKLTQLTDAPTITFAVSMDTHTVALDGYDLRQLATLRIDQGPPIQASGWDAPAGGHHREGTLTFPATTPEATGTIAVIIRDVGGVPERIVQWTR